MIIPEEVKTCVKEIVELELKEIYILIYELKEAIRELRVKLDILKEGENI